MVQKLRTKTGCAMMDCKKALQATDGDEVQAYDWLRKKGLAAASKKSDRATQNGLVTIQAFDRGLIAVEVNCETDFVARNDCFQNFVQKLPEAAYCSKSHTLDELLQASFNAITVEEARVEAINQVGENIQISRIQRQDVNVDNVVMATYAHNAHAINVGSIVTGVILHAPNLNQEDASIQELAKQIAMHIAAASPICLRKNDVDPNTIEKEKEILRQQNVDSMKPQEIIEKIIQGKVDKICEGLALEEQIFVIDNKTKIKQVLADQKTYPHLSILGFIYLAVGQK